MVKAGVKGVGSVFVSSTSGASGGVFWTQQGAEMDDWDLMYLALNGVAAKVLVAGNSSGHPYAVAFAESKR